MLLNSGKLICLEDDGENIKNIIQTNGKIFRIGNYMSCDYVHGHPEAKGIHCEITCDAFGRVSIRNLSEQNPIQVNGCTVTASRPLLSGNLIQILGKQFRWEYQKDDSLSTPEQKEQKSIHPPSSDPSNKERKDIIKRLTVHSFAYGLRAQPISSNNVTNFENNEDTLIEENDEIANAVEKEELNDATDLPSRCNLSTDYNIDTALNINKGNKSKLNENVDIQECRNLENSLDLTHVSELDKENNVSLSRSQILLTSYCPLTPAVRLSKSFLYQTPLKSTPQSEYSTPRGILLEQNLSINKSEYKTSINKGHKSMHLIDLTTPSNMKSTKKLQTNSLIKSAMKNSTKNTVKKLTRNTPTSANFDRSEKTLSRKSNVTDKIKRNLIDSLQSSNTKKSDTLRNKPTTISEKSKTGNDNSISKINLFQRTALDASFPSVINVDSSGETFTESVIEISTDESQNKKSITVNTPNKAKPLLKKALMTSARKVKNFNLKQIEDETEAEPNDKYKKCKLSLTLSPTIKSSPSRLVIKTANAKSNITSQSFNSRQTFSKEENLKQSFGNISTSTPFKLRKSFGTPLTPLRKCKELINSPKSINVSCIFKDNKNSEQQKTRTPMKTNKVTSVKKANKSVQFNETKENPAEEILNKTFTLDLEVNESVPGDERKSRISSKGMEENKERTINKSFVIEEMSTNKTDFHEKCPSESFSNVNNSKVQTLSESQIEITDSINKTQNDGQTEQSIQGDPKEIIKHTKHVIIAQSFDNPQTKAEKKEESNTIQNINDNNLFEKEDSVETPNFSDTSNLDYIKELMCTPKYTKPFPHNTTEDINIEGTPTVNICQHMPTSSTINKIVDFNTSDSQDFPNMSPVRYSTTKQIDNDVAFKTPSGKMTMISGTIEKSTNIDYNIEDEDDDTIDESKLSIPYNVSEKLIDNELFTTPDLFALSKTIEENFDKNSLSAEESFDKLVGRQSVKRKYRRSQSALKQNSENTDASEKNKVENWLENVNHSHYLNNTNPKEEMNLSKVEKRITASKPESDVSGVNELNFTNDTIQSGDLVYSDDELSGFSNFSMSKHIDKLSKSCIKMKSLETSIFDKISKRNRKTIGCNLGNKTEDTSSVSKFIFVENPIFRRIKGKSLSISQEEKPQNTSRRTLYTHNYEKSPSFDIEAGTKRVEIEKAFEYFEEHSSTKSTRGKSLLHFEVNNMEPKSRRTVYNDAKEISFNLDTEKEGVEMEMAFQNFEEHPKSRNTRGKSLIGSERNNAEMKSRKTVYNNEKDISFDLETEKERVEMEKVFENFDEHPRSRNTRGKSLIGSDKNNAEMKSRRTVYNDAKDISFDLEAEKERVKMEKDFENFEQHPRRKNTRGKSLIVSETNNAEVKSRRTVYNDAKDISFDLETEKERVEMEKDFENFEEHPRSRNTRGKSLIGSDKNNAEMKSRRTVYDDAKDISFDLEAEKERVEMEKDFENFEEHPRSRNTRGKSLIGSDKNNAEMKSRRTVYDDAKDISFDLEAEKERVEMEKDFENFEEHPRSRNTRGKSLIGSDKNNAEMKSRRTVYNDAKDISFDLEAEKERVKMEKDFENFEEHPRRKNTRGKSLIVSETNNAEVKSRRTVYNDAKDISFDLETEKERVEMEKDFENFEEHPRKKNTRGKSLIVSKTNNAELKSRRTVYNDAKDISFDLEAEKERVEMEKDFENFEEHPRRKNTRGKSLIVSETNNAEVKSRRTVYNDAKDISFDLETEKERVEMEKDFENFEEHPRRINTRGKSLIVSETNNAEMKSRRTVYNDVEDISFDLETEKERVKMEKDFENFEQHPRRINTRGKSLIVSETNNAEMKSRRTVYNDVEDISFDLETEKERLEMENAFEHFNANVTFKTELRGKSLSPSSPIKIKGNSRKTLNAVVLNVSFNIETEKERVDKEQAFKNFEDDPTIREKRGKSLSHSKSKISEKSSRKTLYNQDRDISFNIENEKERLEMERAFDDFEDYPETIKYTKRKSVPETKMNKQENCRKSLHDVEKNISFDIEKEKERIQIEKEETEKIRHKLEDKSNASKEAGKATDESISDIAHKVKRGKSKKETPKIIENLFVQDIHLVCTTKENEPTNNEIVESSVITKTNSVQNLNEKSEDNSDSTPANVSIVKNLKLRRNRNRNGGPNEEIQTTKLTNSDEKCMDPKDQNIININEENNLQENKAIIKANKNMRNTKIKYARVDEISEKIEEPKNESTEQKERQMDDLCSKTYEKQPEEKSETAKIVLKKRVTRRNGKKIENEKSLEVENREKDQSIIEFDLITRETSTPVNEIEEKISEIFKTSASTKEGDKLENLIKDNTVSKSLEQENQNVNTQLKTSSRSEIISNEKKPLETKAIRRGKRRIENVEKSAQEQFVDNSQNSTITQEVEDIPKPKRLNRKGKNLDIKTDIHEAKIERNQENDEIHKSTNTEITNEKISIVELIEEDTFNNSLKNKRRGRRNQNSHISPKTDLIEAIKENTGRVTRQRGKIKSANKVENKVTEIKENESDDLLAKQDGLETGNTNDNNENGKNKEAENKRSSRSRERKKIDDLLDANTDVLTPTNINNSQTQNDNDEILPQSANNKNQIEFKTPASHIVPRIRRRLRSNSTHSLTPLINAPESQIPKDGFAESTDISDNIGISARRRLRSNSTSFDDPNIEISTGESTELTVSAAAPRTQRRLRSNSTSTPIFDEPNTQTLKGEFAPRGRRRLRSNSTLIDELNTQPSNGEATEATIKIAPRTQRRLRSNSLQDDATNLQEIQLTESEAKESVEIKTGNSAGTRRGTRRNLKEDKKTESAEKEVVQIKNETNNSSTKRGRRKINLSKNNEEEKTEEESTKGGSRKTQTPHMKNDESNTTVEKIIQKKATKKERANDSGKIPAKTIATRGRRKIIDLSTEAEYDEKNKIASPLVGNVDVKVEFGNIQENKENKPLNADNKMEKNTRSKSIRGRKGLKNSDQITEPKSTEAKIENPIPIAVETTQENTIFEYDEYTRTTRGRKILQTKPVKKVEILENPEKEIIPEKTQEILNKSDKLNDSDKPSRARSTRGRRNVKESLPKENISKVTVEEKNLVAKTEDQQTKTEKITEDIKQSGTDKSDEVNDTEKIVKIRGSRGKRQVMESEAAEITQNKRPRRKLESTTPLDSDVVKNVTGSESVNLTENIDNISNTLNESDKTPKTRTTRGKRMVIEQNTSELEEVVSKRVTRSRRK